MIFLSYRRDDSASTVKRLYFELTQFLPDTKVCMDTQSIETGIEFRSKIIESVRRSTIVLAIIGPNWNPIDPITGRHRLHNEHDMVRLEIKEALRGYKYVFPLILDGASLPKLAEVPSDIADLLGRNALYLYSSDIVSGANMIARQFSLEVVEIVAELEQIGNGFLVDGKPGEALRFYNQAITLNNKNASLYSNRGSANEALGNLEGAINDYDQAILLNPEKSLTYAMRSMGKLSMNLTQSALEDIELAIVRNKTEHRFYSQRATIFMTLNRAPEEIQDLSYCISLCPGEASYYKRRGLALLDLKREKEASADFKEAIKRDPNDNESRKVLAQIVAKLARPW